MRQWAFRGATAALVSIGVALRVLTTIGYSPGNVSHPDTGSYVDAAAHSLFSDPFRPAGYALVLRLLHWLSPNLSFTIAVQHVLGLATAWLGYRIARQLGARRAVALLPAAAVLLSGDQLYLEYSVLSDCLFLAVVLLAVRIALAVPASKGPGARGVGLAVAAALVTALSATIRTVGIALVPVLLIWLLGYGGERWRVRVTRAGAATGVCLAVLLGYAAAQQQATGVFGLSRFGAWPLYARVAPIADCRRFTPPPGTAVLCDPAPVDQRWGPDFYLWNPYSPAQRLLGFAPSHSRQVGAFARSAIVHQPLDYLGTVARDLARYVDPSLVTLPQWGADSHAMALNQPWNTPEAFGLGAVTRYYRHVHLGVDQGLMNALERWREVFRIHGALIALTGLLALAGLLAGPDRRAFRSIVLLIAFAAVLFVVPTATMSYEARYGVPASLLLLIAAARSGELVVGRVRWNPLRVGSPVSPSPHGLGRAT